MSFVAFTKIPILREPILSTKGLRDTMATDKKRGMRVNGNVFIGTILGLGETGSFDELRVNYYPELSNDELARRAYSFRQKYVAASESDNAEDVAAAKDVLEGWPKWAIVKAPSAGKAATPTRSIAEMLVKVKAETAARRKALETAQA